MGKDKFTISRDNSPNLNNFAFDNMRRSRQAETQQVKTDNHQSYKNSKADSVINFRNNDNAQQNTSRHNSPNKMLNGKQLQMAIASNQKNGNMYQTFF